MNDLHLTKSMNSLRKSQAGQTTLEFAMTIVLLMTLIFGMIDISRMVYTVSIVQAAATEGARTGVIDVDGVVSTVHGKMVGLDETRTQVDISMPDDSSILVGVTYQFRFIAPIVAQVMNSKGFNLHGSAQMLIR